MAFYILQHQDVYDKYTIGMARCSEDEFLAKYERIYECKPKFISFITNPNFRILYYYVLAKYGNEKISMYEIKKISYAKLMLDRTIQYLISQKDKIKLSKVNGTLSPNMFPIYGNIVHIKY